MPSIPRLGFLREVARGAVKRRLAPVVRALTPKRVDPPLSSWGLSAADGRLACEGQDLHELLAAYGSPLHVVVGRKLDENAAKFTTKPRSARRACEVFYSYKTNPIPGVLSRLHARGVGAEVISPYELWLALRLGVPPSKIVYNGPAKSDASIDLAVEREVGLLNVNHAEEIERVVAAARKHGKRPKVGIRVGTKLGWSGQFGAGAGAAAIAAFKAAFAAPELDVVGVHAHLGLPIDGEPVLHAFLDELSTLLDELEDKTGFAPAIVDVGGSLAAAHVAHLSEAQQILNRAFHADLVPPDATTRLDARAYAAIVARRIEQRAARRGREAPRIFLEPGRALTSDAQVLLASVVTTKEEDGLTWAILDAGVNVAECVKHEYHQLFPVNRYGEAPVRPHRLAGPICTPGDVLYASWNLPLLRPGDSLAICDAGAYFVPFATSFSFPKPGVVLVDGGRVQPLRRAETFEDLVALDLDVAAEPAAGAAPQEPPRRAAPTRTRRRTP